MTTINDLKCLYKTQAEVRLSRGNTERPFDDVNCFYCQEYYSAIMCPHHVDRKHLREFKRLDLRIQIQ
jgi:hypothetical protein